MALNTLFLPGQEYLEMKVSSPLTRGTLASKPAPTRVVDDEGEVSEDPTGKTAGGTLE